MRDPKALPTKSSPSQRRRVNARNIGRISGENRKLVAVNSG
jgi:hypothetical protein